MCNNLYRSSSLSTFLMFGVFLIWSGSLYSQIIKSSESNGNWTDITWSPTGNPGVGDDVIINHTVVIPEGTTVEIQNLEIAKDGILVVDGVLKVKGNLEMSHNSSVFEMGDTAYVIIDGNLSASNQVSISVSSYLIIYGDFTKSGSSTQGELIVEGGNIYIFGEVDENWNNLDTCEEYQGDTGAIENENCDYGTGEHFENNQDEFPDELKDLIPCLNAYEWTGTVDSNWNNPANWSCNSLPTLQTHVTIPAATPFSPILNSGDDGYARNLIIDLGAEITVIDRQLSVAGEVSVSGTLDITSGSFALVGSTSQIIPFSTLFNNELQNLIVRNPEGVISEATLRIIKSLKVEEGIFNTGNNLILISDASGAAFIDGSGTGEVLGSVTMQRYLSNSFGYKYISTPFNNSTVADFAAFIELEDATTGFPHFYRYRQDRQDTDDNDLTGWEAYTDTGSALNIAEGYAANLSGGTNPLTLEILGEVNNGEVNIELKNSNGKFTNGFNLVGNPYPSPVDWTRMIPALQGIDDAIHFFTAASDNRYTGTYTSFVNGVSTDDRSSNIIPSMQGFFVRVSDPEDGVYPATATLSFTNSARTGNSVAQEFYKTKEKPEVPKIRLSAGFSGEEESDATVIYFQNGATLDFEQDIDAQKMLNTAVHVPSLYSLSHKKEKLAINAISFGENALTEIPLGISAQKSGKMEIFLTKSNGIPTSLKLYLKDKKKNLLQDLSIEPRYFFTSQKGEINDRFVLVLTSEAISEVATENLEPFSVHTALGEILVRLNLDENTSGKVFLSTLSGQILQKKYGKGSEEIRFSSFTAPGIYFISLDIGNERVTKKLLLKK